MTSSLPRRPPAVAGSFYPGAPSTLQATVDALLAAAHRNADVDLRSLKAVIVPHAGYVYSGPIAATAYALLAGLADRIRRVVLVGPAHRVYVEHLASAGAGVLETPLGDVAAEDAAGQGVP